MHVRPTQVVQGSPLVSRSLITSAKFALPCKAVFTGSRNGDLDLSGDHPVAYHTGRSHRLSIFTLSSADPTFMEHHHPTSQRRLLVLLLSVILAASWVKVDG